jgi:anthranilate phosphoribosyltransferase
MPTFKVMGVPSPDFIDIEIKTLRELGFRRAFVMHGLDDNSDKGMDEISTLGRTLVAELDEDGKITRYELEPEQFGIRRTRFEEVASSRDVDRDATALLRVITHSDQGPRSDIICLNAAPLLYVSGEAETLEEGLAMARGALTEGRALEKLRDWVRWQNDTPQVGMPTLEAMLAKAL